MNWNDAAEDLLSQILSRTPRPLRDAAEQELRASAEELAAGEDKRRVGVETVIAAWIQSTPAALREDLPRQIEALGLEPADYAHLLNA